MSRQVSLKVSLTAALLLAAWPAGAQIEPEGSGWEEAGTSEQPAVANVAPTGGSSPAVASVAPSGGSSPAVASVAPSGGSSPAVEPPADPRLDELGAGGWDRSKRPVTRRVLHGFRLGYLHLMNYDRPVASNDPSCQDCTLSVKERYGLRSPHQFLIGYEVMGRMVGHEWLNVLIVGNVMASGIEQSKFLPAANLLIGFEFDESFQIGVGPNLTLEREKPAHMVMAAGWTPEVGSFHVPVHAFFIPDVDQNHRLGMTVGVNW
jgi:hypothetical protein